MFYAKNNEILSLCTAIKYTYTQNETFDYSNAPRPCHNFVFMLEGRGSIRTENAMFSVKKGDVLFIPQGTTYTSHWLAEPTAAFHSIHFNFLPNTDPFRTKKIPIQILPCENFGELYQSVLKLQAYQYAKNTDSFLALAAFYEVCGKITPSITAFSWTGYDGPIAPALAYIENNYTLHCDVKELAELCFLSVSRFHFLFKQQTGYAPIVYKNRLAIRHAAQSLLLEREKSIEEISEEYGFESAIYFRRLFKNITGKTPTQYRKSETLL